MNINLTLVLADEFQIPVLRQAFSVSHNFMKRLYYIFILTSFFSTTLFAQQIQTTTIKGKRYVGHLDSRGFFVTGSKRDTILHLSADDYMSFKFKDFNKDGYNDVFLEWGGNIPDRNSLYLFVPSSGKFKELKNFSDFPSPKFIKGTKYSFSYYRAGCADNTWGSDLFYITNNTAIKIGNIKGEGCGIKDGIYIYKVKAHKKILFKTFPLITIDKYKDQKWGFLKQYWTKNYSSFL